MNELEAMLDEYLAERRTLAQLEGWLASHTRSFLQSDNARAIEVLNQLEADLVDVGEGLLDETAFRREWERRRALLRTIELTVDLSPAGPLTSSIKLGTSAHTQRVDRRIGERVGPVTQAVAA